jgi:hypothetical protein
MIGKLSRPSHKCPRIQVCALPTRQIGTFFLAASRPANTIMANPTLP